VVLAFLVCKQLTPFEDGYVDEIHMNLRPKRPMRVLSREQIVLDLALKPRAVEGQVAHEAAAKSHKLAADAPAGLSGGSSQEGAGNNSSSMPLLIAVMENADHAANSGLCCPMRCPEIAT
jgi:hypothetical protein